MPHALVLIFGDTVRAMKNYFQALSICEETNYKYGVASMQWNIGFTYAWDYYDYEKTLNYVEKAKAIFLELGDYEIAGSGKMSGIYLSMGDYDTALQYLNEGLQYFVPISQP